MPELPEVTTTVKGLRKVLPNLSIKDVWTDYYIGTKYKQKDTLKNKKYFKKFKKEIIGSKFKDVERRGKYILVHLNKNKTILVHMKMTGHFLYGKYIFKNKKWQSDEKNLKDPFNGHLRFVISLSNGKNLAFSDMRKFGTVRLFETDFVYKSIHLKELGVDPLNNLSFKKLKSQLLKKPTLKIKTALMDQSLIAGIGNIYSDEILWESCIHPEKKVLSISDNQYKRILNSMIKILKKSISMGGDSMSDYRNINGEKGGFQNSHKVYRKTKEICSKRGCGGIIKRIVIGGRSTHFCDKHQKM
ncbi:MAG: DNA-formamidopyrimidine glycosylase [Candidatus Paceibacterota bacterium]